MNAEETLKFRSINLRFIDFRENTGCECLSHFILAKTFLRVSSKLVPAILSVTCGLLFVTSI